MKTLTELYGQAVADNPEVTKVMFTAAYPEATDDKLADTMLAIQAVMEPFFKKWQDRLIAEYRLRIEKNMHPEVIEQQVPWLTSSEYSELLSLIDGYLPGDSDEVGAMRVTDLIAYSDMMRSNAVNIMMRTAMEHQQKSRIINPFEQNGTGARIIPMNGSIITP